jgi:predicted flap endonuclease-1-like 5' DNA nuclease
MSSYIPVIIGAVVIIGILFWWLLARNCVKKAAAPSHDVTPVPPVAVPAPPVSKAVAAKVKTAKPAAPKPAAKVAAPKPATPKATVAKVAAPKASAKPAVTNAKADPARKPKATKAAAKAKVAVPDNLELLKGLGPKVNAVLKSLGVTSFAQVASWTAADVAEIDGKLGAFAGRISRDNWIDQAKYLEAGDVAGFEKKYGALGSAGAKG